MRQTSQSLSRPLGIVTLPVPVGRQVHPHPVPHEADHPVVGHPRHPGLEVVHDSQLLGCSLEIICTEVCDPDHLVTTDVPPPHIIHCHQRSAVHMVKKTFIIFILV